MGWNSNSPLMEGAVFAHEMFTTYVNAGFTEDQALEIVISLMLAHLGKEES